jgi:hypothetical protein
MKQLYNIQIMLDPTEASRGYALRDPINGVLTLETQRFDLSWHDAEVGKLSDGHVAEFQIAAEGLMTHLSNEASGEPEREREALARRSDAVMFFSTVMNVAGSSVSYCGDRNARYTNMGLGMGVMAEPLNPELPSGAGNMRPGGIHNPLNYPEYSK